MLMLYNDGTELLDLDLVKRYEIEVRHSYNKRRDEDDIVEISLILLLDKIHVKSYHLEGTFLVKRKGDCNDSKWINPLDGTEHLIKLFDLLKSIKRYIINQLIHKIHHSKRKNAIVPESIYSGDVIEFL